MSGLLSTGSSALLAFQRALATVSHNVANVDTPGYSRQRVELAARPGQAIGAGYMGSGVQVENLRRLADGLVFARQVDSSGELGRLQQLSSMASRVDALTSDAATGLSGPWSGFFGAAQAVATSPTSTTARSQLITAGQQLANRWHALDSQFSGMDKELSARLGTSVADVNRLSGEIANLNRDIVAAGTNAAPDLIDAREQRVEQLATLVGANTLAQDDGSLSVFTAGGQALVLGTRAQSLSTVPDPYHPERLQLALASPAGPVPLASTSVAGDIGGLLEFRSRVLDPTRAELGRLATGFATTFNAAQQAGVDFNGNPGAAMFALSAPRVAAHSANGGSATLSATVADVAALQGPDLVLEFTGSGWQATRADGGQPVPMTGTGSAADPLRVAGLSLVVAGSAVAGDRFQVTPTAGASSGIAVVLTDPSAIAAAGPLQTTADAANLGTARPGAAQVDDPVAFAAFTGATIDFIDSNQYTIDGAGPYAYSPGTPIASGGWSLPIDGAPAAGDRFVLSRTPPHSADNSNARTLASLDRRPVLDGGNLDITDAMGQLTARVGSDARHADLSLQAQQAIHGQITAERDSVSGVNLDEEAADLLRFQQAYQAAAQVITTADNLFQTLIGAIRR
jgi:flagellar hook-associated protein 1 FlgK